MLNCPFCRIVAHELPAEVVYEDDHVIAFNDINPLTPVHILVVPKQHVEYLHQITDTKLLAQLFDAVNAIVRKTGLDQTGYRIVSNNGKHGGQEVMHVHFHILGGRMLAVPN